MTRAIALFVALCLVGAGCAPRDVVVTRWPKEPVRCVVVNEASAPVLVAEAPVAEPPAPGNAPPGEKQRPPTVREPVYERVPAIVVRHGQTETVMGVEWSLETDAYVVWLLLSPDEVESISGWKKLDAAKAALARYQRAYEAGGRPSVMKQLNADPDDGYVEPRGFTYEENLRISDATAAAK